MGLARVGWCPWRCGELPFICEEIMSALAAKGTPMEKAAILREIDNPSEVAGQA